MTRNDAMTDATLYRPGMAALTVVPQERIPGPGSSSIAAILARIEEAVDDETAGIRGNPRFDLKASNARKSRHLYELNRATRGQVADVGAEHRDALARLRAKLAENEMALKAHLSAVGEVAALLQDVIERHEADGTYSSSAAQRTARA